MGHTNSNRKNDQARSKKTVEVLYQKMGDRWFAFSLIEDEVFIGSIAQDELDENTLPPEKRGNLRELG